FMGTPSTLGKVSGLTLMWISPLILGFVSWLIPLLQKNNDTNWEAKNLLLSLGAAIIAIALLKKWSPAWQKSLKRTIWFQGANFFDHIWYGHLDFAKFIRGLIQPNSLVIYILTVFSAFTLGVLWLILSKDLMGSIFWPTSLPLNDVFVWLCFGKIITTFFILRTHTPILLVLFLGLVGYLFALVLTLAGAPDLAMTQFSVETL